MSIEAVIGKIQKLRRLARSTNLNEAAAAAAAADRLIQEYGLAEAELQAEGKTEKEAPVEDSSPLASWRRAPTWQRILATRLIRHYDCAGYMRWAWAGGEQVLQHCVVGRPTDMAAARYMYGWLTVEIERLAQLHRGKGRSYLDSFRRGAVQGVCDKLFRSASDRSGFSAGREAGRNIHVGAALSGASGRSLKGLMAKKSGQGWCAICSRRIEGGTSVGCGDGSRTGRDGRFAHKECYPADGRQSRGIGYEDNRRGNHARKGESIPGSATGQPAPLIESYSRQVRP